MENERLHDAPTRPTLPPLLVVALMLWATVAATLPWQMAWSETLTTTVALGAAMGAVGFGAAGWMLFHRKSYERSWPLWALFAVLGICLGLCLSSVQALKTQTAAHLPSASETWMVELAEDASPGDFGQQATAWVSNGENRPRLIQLTMAEGPELLLRGARFEGAFRLKAVTATQAEYAWRNGIVASGVIEKAEPEPPEGFGGVLYGLRKRAIEALTETPTAAGPLMAALACGYRGVLDQSQLYDAFQRCGLAHLVAVSGAHLTLMALILLSLLRLTRCPRSLQIVAVVGVAGMYLAFAGMAVSTVRALFMLAASSSSYFARRRSFSLNALGLCVLLFIAIEPACALSVSFGLSVGATLGIVLFAPLLDYWLSFGHARAADLLEPFSLTFASDLTTQAASVALFHQLPLISPVANLLATPLFPLAFAASVGAALGAVAFPALAGPIVAAAALATAPLMVVVQFCAALPLAALPLDVPMGFALAVTILGDLALWCWWPTRFKVRYLAIGAALLGAGMLGLCLRGFYVDDEIVMLDVGQGDAFVLRSQGVQVMIDTGRNDSMLKEALGRHGIYHVDALILTHGDDDHCGSMDALATVASVDRVLVAADALNCSCDACRDMVGEAKEAFGVEPQGLSVGADIEVGAFKLQTLWPRRFTDEGGNGDSLTFLVSDDADRDGDGDWSGLFCGDAEAEVLSQLEADGAIGAVDVLKVGHHGSKKALTQKLVTQLQPDVALVSVGANNRYGHPAAETLELLDSVSATILRTDERGDVTLHLTASSINVSTQK